MTFVSLGDLSRSYQLRSHNARLKTELSTLATELAGGRKSDLSRALGGDFSALSGVERALSSLSAFRTSAAEASLFAESQQRTLETLQGDLQDLSGRLLVSSTILQPSYVDSVGAEARQRFEAALSRLNGTVAGRTIFSGAATDRPAVAGADDILAALQAATAADTTAADVAATIDTFFGPGGDWETLAYLGSTQDLAPWRIGPDTEVTLSISADDMALRGALKGLAMAALLDTGALGSDLTERRALAQTAGTALLSGQDGLLAERARLGTAEEAIANAQAANEAEASALSVVRSKLIGADPYETAARLQETETQLETLYTLTARLSRLTLTDYLR